MKLARFLLRGLHRCEDVLLALLLLALGVLPLAQIVLRNFFSSGLLWGEEFARILVLWIALLGALIATRERQHIAIDVASQWLSGPSWRIIRGLVYSAVAIICLLAAWSSFRFVQFEYEDGFLAFAGVPNWIVYSVLPLGFGLIGLRIALQAWQPASQEQGPPGGQEDQ